MLECLAVADVVALSIMCTHTVIAYRYKRNHFAFQTKRKRVVLIAFVFLVQLGDQLTQAHTKKQRAADRVFFDFLIIF